MNEIRCFIALEIPVEIQKVLNGVIRELKSAGADVKWVEPGNIHLTLKFLGSLDRGRADEVGALVKSYVGRFPAINSGLGAVGAFPNLGRPQVIWTGLGQGLQEIAAIFNELEDGLKALGFPEDQRKFSPHLTLGRVRSGRNLHQLSEKLKSSVPVINDFIIGDMTLFKSTLTPKGAVYQTLEKIELSTLKISACG
jgi:2'-5' RNA ligase